MYMSSCCLPPLMMCGAIHNVFIFTIKLNNPDCNWIGQPQRMRSVNAVSDTSQGLKLLPRAQQTDTLPCSNDCDHFYKSDEWLIAVVRLVDFDWLLLWFIKVHFSKWLTAVVRLVDFDWSLLWFIEVNFSKFNRQQKKISGITFFCIY